MAAQTEDLSVTGGDRKMSWKKMALVATFAGILGVARHPSAPSLGPFGLGDPLDAMNLEKRGVICPSHAIAQQASVSSLSDLAGSATSRS